MSVDFSRRKFLRRSAAAGTAALVMPSFVARTADSVLGLGETLAPSYTGWADIYRKQWTWDKVVRGTHLVNCWYQAHCSWDVYVKDGMVFREEQAGEYEPVNANLPDFNPRGCNKGSCFSEKMYDPTRLKYPLKRVGERGGNKWKRITWDEALDEIADTWLDVSLKEGTDRTILDLGPGIDVGVATAGVLRFGVASRAIALDMNSEIGDAHRGAAVTFGTMTGDRSMDDYFYSDLILYWCNNPMVTQIPNAHFLNEARYNGAKIHAIAPDYNASAVHADLFVPVKPATDTALALGLCHLLMVEGGVNEAFCTEQTDMPLLIRMDTKGFLKEAEIRKGDYKNTHLFINEADEKIVAAPKDSLSLGDYKPKLEASATVKLLDGSEVEVRTVYSLIRERLKGYTPEFVAEICGIGVGMIRRMFKDVQAAKAMANVTSSNINKFYHGNLTERSMILLFALKGQFGQKGSGYSAFPFLSLDGLDPFALISKPDDFKALMHSMESMMKTQMAAGKTQEEIIYDMSNSMFIPGSSNFEGVQEPRLTCGALFWSIHGGIIADNADKTHDPFAKRPMQEYVDESLAKGHQFVAPDPGNDPRIMFSISSNSVRRVRGADAVLKNLYPKLDLSVVMDFRMNSTTQQADIILPVAGWYERTTHKWVTTLSPYLTVTNQAVKPYFESKTDWEIMGRLAQRIQDRAKVRGIKNFTNQDGENVRVETMGDWYTMNGEFPLDNDEKVMEHILKWSTNADVDWEELKEKGFARYKSIGHYVMGVGNMCEIPEDDSITHFTYHTRDKVPWATDTRRMQFYQDQDLYHEMDEVLPRYKHSPQIGGDYPLMMTSGHPRESVHANWRDSRIMLRLTRGEPFIMISPKDAEDRGIEDTDWVRVFNDVGEYHVRAKVAPSIQPAQTLIYHAWESYQFPKGSPRSVMATPMNPVELSGGYTHLRPVFTWSQPNIFDRDTRIEIVKLNPDEVGV
ncbi:MAG: molybdopterin-dependent oxidoreductase [Photobacterium aquimaris]|nr:molybdopterin-dependent oxidoreductase [Photobacterium aquimaris]